MLSYKTKRKLADAARWGIFSTWVGYPVIMGVWTLAAGGFTGALVLEFLLLTAVCAGMSSAVTSWRDQLKMKEQKQLPPHKYDRDVLWWERDDEVELMEDEDGSSVTTKFLGFTDDKTAVFKEKKPLKDSPPLREHALPELESYRNDSAQDRKNEAQREKLLSKVNSSYYNEKLDELRKLESRKREVMQEIDDDPEIAEFEEQLDELPEPENGSEAIGEDDTSENELTMVSL